SATPLQPLPTRVVVGLDVRDASPEHQRLAARFLAGVQRAGRKTGPQPTVVLHLTISSLDGGTGVSNREPERGIAGLSGLQGGVQPSLPAMPDDRITQPRTPPVRRLLV